VEGLIGTDALNDLLVREVGIHQATPCMASQVRPRSDGALSTRRQCALAHVGLAFRWGNVLVLFDRRMENPASNRV
jgi:hypothetical protein